MKKYIALAIVVVILLSGVAVYASDITEADYKSSIEVTNNSTALTNEATVFTLSTQAMIDANMLSANASDCAIQYDGSDVAFMPGVGSNPWVTWVDSLGADSILYEYLYSKGATGGKIRYFPGPTGMETADNASLEYSDNFSYEFSGYVDTSQTGNISKKDNAFWVGVTDTGEITAHIVGGNSYVATGVSSGEHKVEVMCRDSGILASYVPTADRYASIGSYFTSKYYAQTFTNPANYPITVYQIGVDIYREAGADWDVTLELRTMNGSEPANPGANPGDNSDTLLSSCSFNASTLGTSSVGTGYHTLDTEVTLSADTEYAIIVRYQDPYHEIKWDALAVGAYSGGSSFSGDGYPWTARADDFQFGLSSYPSYLYIDGVLEDKDTTANTAPNTADNWIDGDPDVTPYIEYVKRYVNDVLVQHIEWEYDTVFNNAVGVGNDATPTFRTISTAASLSANVTKQEALTDESYPSGNVSGGWTMIAEVPATPDNLFTEGGDTYGIGGFDIGQKVTDAAEGAGQDPTHWHLIVAFGLALLAMMGTYKVTHNDSMGQRGSLLLAAIVAEGVLIFFYQMLTIPGLALIPFGMFALLLIVWRKSPSPVD